MTPQLSKLMLIVGIVIIASILAVTRKVWIGAFAHGVPSTWRIAKMTVEEAKRKRVLHIMVLLAVVIIGSLLFFTYLSPAEQARMVKDSGLITITVFGILLSVFLTAFMIPHEIESRTIYPILAKPVRRYEFVLGKYLGVLIILGVIVSVITVVLVGVLLLQNHLVLDQVDSKFEPAIPAVVFAAVMSYVAIAVLTALILLISTVASTTMTVISALLLWVVGSMQSTLYDLSSQVTGVTKFLVLLFYHVVPPFQNFDFRQDVSNMLPISLPAAVDGLEKGALYLIVALLFAAIFFENRQV